MNFDEFPRNAHCTFFMTLQTYEMTPKRQWLTGNGSGGWPDSELQRGTAELGRTAIGVRPTQIDRNRPLLQYVHEAATAKGSSSVALHENNVLSTIIQVIIIIIIDWPRCYLFWLKPKLIEGISMVGIIEFKWTLFLWENMQFLQTPSMHCTGCCLESNLQSTSLWNSER